MLPFKVIYHPRYDLNLGTHVFPSQKFRFIAEKLRSSGIADDTDFLRPQAAPDVDLLRVHTPSWVHKLKTGTLSASEIMKLEVPYSPELAEAVWLAAGGTILAAQCALRDGFGSNLSGGFHHAYANHGEGFCAIHDVAVAVRRLQADGAIKKAMIVDTDVHHGNGTAAIFHDDASVFTISIHQWNNYPAHKPPSDVDLNMPDGVGDREYLAALLPAVQQHLDEFHPDMLFYVGGADPYDAAFALFVPLVRSVQLVLDTTGNEDGAGDLGVRVGPFFAGFGTLIFEDADIFEADVFFEVGDARAPDLENALNFFVGKLGEAAVVLGSLDDNFVGAGGSHFVVHAFGEAARLAFDAVERIGMGQDANLRRAIGGRRENGLRTGVGAVKGTMLGGFVGQRFLALNHPALRYGVSANFHRDFL